MPLKIKFIKDDDEGILPYCEEEDAEKFYFQQILTARFSWGSNNIPEHGHTMYGKGVCHANSIADRKIFGTAKIISRWNINIIGKAGSCMQDNRSLSKKTERSLL